jgi:small-conductance mechanosensitive channel
VVERGLLDTEIQTEQKELLALPNIYLISHPIATTSSTGTIISTTLSLGYDAHHAEIETLLLKAATLCELENPFVHILRLDDYSVVYKISGVLKDVKSLLSARSKLCSCVLDTLHENNVEIMSPAFVNQKRLPEAFNTIPLKKSKRNQTETKKVDSEIFDKAEAAAELEQTRARIMSEIEALKQTLKDADSETSNSIQNRIDNLLESLKSLEQKDLS